VFFVFSEIGLSQSLLVYNGHELRVKFIQFQTHQIYIVKNILK
jgi:hypothetical protein